MSPDKLQKASFQKEKIPGKCVLNWTDWYLFRENVRGETEPDQKKYQCEINYLDNQIKFGVA